MHARRHRFWNSGRTSSRTSEVGFGIGFALLSIGWFCLESTIAHRLNLSFSLIPVILVFLVLQLPMIPSCAYAISIGYLADLFGGERPGLVVSAWTITFLLLRLVVVRVVSLKWYFVVLLSMFASVSGFLAMFALDAWLGANELRFVYLRKALPAELVSLAILSYPFFLVLTQFQRFFYQDGPSAAFGGKRL